MKRSLLVRGPKKWMGKVLLLACLILVVFLGNRPVKAEEQIGTVTASVERFTIGQGYFVEPTQLPLYQGDTAKDILDRLVGAENYESRSTNYGFYLASINNADSGKTVGEINVPYYIQKMSGFAVTNETNDGNKHFPGLGEFSYTSKSGWMYSVNNAFPQTSMQNQKIADKDVIRFQFTLWGTGADVGDNGSGNTAGIEIANRDAMSQFMGSIKARDDYSVLMKKGFFKEAWDNAIAVMTDLEQQQTVVDSAQAYLQDALNAKDLKNISLDKQNLNLIYGKTETLAVIYDPIGSAFPQGVQWSSSDGDIAFVNNGEVEATGIGTATITATLGDYSSSCVVTVTDSSTPTPSPTPTPTPGQPSAEDTAVVQALINKASSLDASTTVTLSQLQTFQNAYAALTDTQKALLTDTQKSALSKTLADAASKALDAVLSEVQTAMDAAQKDIRDTGDISDASMVGLVAADKDLTAIGAMDLAVADKTTWQVKRSNLDVLEKTIQTTINNTSSGVTVKGRSLTLPWTVKLVAEKVDASREQEAELASNSLFKDPIMATQYKIVLKDFSSAADAENIPEYEAKDKTIKITLPAFSNYSPLAIGQENLTLLNKETVVGSKDSNGNAIVTYSAAGNAFSFSTTSGASTFAVVSDSRVPVTAFTLSDTTKTLMLNQTDPSFTLSVKSRTPADTTDLSRITWTSSDEKVAAVTAEGVVTGKAQGTAVITASVNGLSQTCTVTVKTNAYVDYDSYFSTFRKDNTNMAIVDAALPNGSTEATKNLTAKWINSGINSGSYATVGTPLVVGDNIYVSAESQKLYKLNKSTGAVEEEAALSANVGFFSYATYGDGMIFVPEDGGIVEAFNASTLDSLWRSEAFGGQSNCQLTYANGYIYSGTWSGSTGAGTFYCIDATDKGLASQTGNVRKAAWKAADTGGYYWAGAAVVGSNVVFGGDSGTVYVCDQATGAIKSQYATGGAIRGCIAYDAATGSIYFTGGDGGGSGMNGITGNPKCYRIAIDASTGQLGAVQTTALPAISTGTPVVYNGRVYVATQLTSGSGFAPDYSTATTIDQSSKENGKLCVIDAASMGLIYTVDLGGPSKASPLLTTAYTGDGKQTVYLYLTVNCHDGAVVRVKDYAGNTTPDSEVIYRPSSDEQEYTTTSLNCDADGVIYYRNDKGHLMALVGTSEGVNDPSKNKGTTASKSSSSASGTQSNGSGSTGTTGSSTSGGSGSAAKTGTASKSAAPAASGWSFDTAMSPDGDGSGSAASGQVKQASALLGSCAGGIALVYTLLMAVVRTRKKVL